MGNYFLFCVNGEIPEVVVKYSFRSRFVDGGWIMESIMVVVPVRLLTNLQFK